MNRENRTVQLLTDWLEDQPSRAPDALLESVLADLPRARQRARWWLALRSFLMFGTDSPRFSIAVVAIALTAVVALGVWGRQQPVGPGADTSPSPAVALTPEPPPPPAATAAPTQAAPPAPAPTPERIVARREDIPLAPGNWSTADSFPVKVSFDVPEGWMGWYSARSVATIFRAGKDPDGAGVGLFFALVRNVYADPCRFAESGLLSPAVGPSVDDLVTALVSLTDANVSLPAEIIVDGYQGTQLTITAPDSIEGCSPLQPQYRIMRLPNGHSTWMEPGETQAISIIDVDGTRLVIITWEMPDASPRALAEVQQIFDSIRLEPAP